MYVIANDPPYHTQTLLTTSRNHRKYLSFGESYQRCATRAARHGTLGAATRHKPDLECNRRHVVTRHSHATRHPARARTMMPAAQSGATGRAKCIAVRTAPNHSAKRAAAGVVREIAHCNHNTPRAPSDRSSSSAPDTSLPPSSLSSSSSSSRADLRAPRLRGALGEGGVTGVVIETIESRAHWVIDEVVCGCAHATK
jgi:hypothetical protein